LKDITTKMTLDNIKRDHMYKSVV